MLETVVFHGPASRGDVKLLKLLLSAVNDVNVQVKSAGISTFVFFVILKSCSTCFWMGFTSCLGEVPTPSLNIMLALCLLSSG